MAGRPALVVCAGAGATTDLPRCLRMRRIPGFGNDHQPRRGIGLSGGVCEAGLLREAFVEHERGAGTTPAIPALWCAGACSYLRVGIGDGLSSEILHSDGRSAKVAV